MLYVLQLFIIFVQVFSSSVANALKLTGGTEASEAANFIDLMDKFFDSFNVLSISKGKYEKKDFKQPYRYPTDSRLKVNWLCKLW